MKSASVLVFIVTLLGTGLVHAQHRDDRDAFFTPSIRSAWLEGLVLGLPAGGLGVDLDASRAYEDSDSSSSYALGVRGWIGTGVPLPKRGTYKWDTYVDFDLLLHGSIYFDSFSAALLGGYGYRIWYGETSPPSGHRLKLGVELNYVILDGRISLRARAMGAAPATTGDFEYGAVALGIAFGWFRLK